MIEKDYNALINRINETELRLERLNEALKYAFIITEEENAEIQKWIEQHSNEHPDMSGDGMYQYAFIPTSSGIKAYVSCLYCDESFEFRK